MALHALVLLAVLAAVSACEEKPVHSPVAPSTTTSAPGPQQIPAATRIIRFSGDIDFGGVELGNMPAKPFSVCNDGNASLAIMSIEVPNGY
jgi:hypothetical protein